MPTYSILTSAPGAAWAIRTLEKMESDWAKAQIAIIKDCYCSSRTSAEFEHKLATAWDIPIVEQ